MKITDVSKNINNEEPQAVLFKWNYKGENIDKKWQISISVFLVLCFALFLWQKNNFGAILILIILFLIFMLPSQKKEQYFTILKRGVGIGNEVFPWENLESFWIFEDPPELYIKNKKMFPSYLTLPLNKQDIGRVKNILLNYLPEKETERSINDIISKKLGL